MNCTEIKQLFSIVTYLEMKGYSPIKISGSGCWYHSPFTNDRHASFQVSKDGKKFHDWSHEGKYGTIIDLSMQFCNTNNVRIAIQDIVNTIGGNTPLLGISHASKVADEHTKSPIKVIEDRPVSSKLLMGYAYGRGRITREILCEYCREIRYENAGRRYYALGFRNNIGGYELRSSCFKGSTAPKSVTTINDMADCTYLVFEGFFDFLSAVHMNWFRPNEMNAVVLNSTANTKQSFNELKNARRIVCLLDNDTPGREATALILQQFPNAEDKSFLFLPAKDLNEYNSNIRAY